MFSIRLDRATNERFTAFNINSIHMNITSGLRRTSTPTVPMVKSTAESSKGRVWLLNAMPTDLDTFENNAAATLTGGASDAALWAGQIIDLDGEGNPDLLVCSPGNDTMQVTGSCAGVPLAALYTGGDHSPVEGVPFFTSVVMGDLFGTGMLVEDRDGDGDDDLWLAGQGDTGSLLFFRNQQ